MNNLVPLYLFGTVLAMGLIASLIIVLILYKHRQATAQHREQHLSQAYNEQMLRTKIEVQDATLNEVGRELHDNVCQMLTASVMELSSVGQRIPEGRESDELSATRQTIKDVISNVRLLSHSLSATMIETRSIEDAIQSELRRVSAFSSISCVLDADAFYEPEPGMRLLLFRIVQEALQNALKHAKATKITVSLTMADADSYNLSIADDGVGFDAAQLTPGQSLGIVSMGERVALMEGRLNIISSSGKGTRLVVTIPVNRHK